jgi:hypothetical protein
LFDGVGSAFHPDRFVLEHFEIRLRLEVCVRGGVGAVAGSLDLPGCLTGSVVAGLRGRVGRHDGTDRCDGRQCDQQRSDRAAETSETGPWADASMARGASSGVSMGEMVVGIAVGTPATFGAGHLILRHLDVTT